MRIYCQCRCFFFERLTLRVRAAYSHRNLHEYPLTPSARAWMIVIGGHGTSYIFTIPRGERKSRGNEPMRMQKAHSLCTKLEHGPLSASLTNRSNSSSREHSERRRLCDRRTSTCRLGAIDPSRSFGVAQRSGSLDGRPSDLRLCEWRLISKACRGPIGKLALFNRFIAAGIVSKINLTRSRDFLLRVQ
jgi:hypothetical protein